MSSEYDYFLNYWYNGHSDQFSDTDAHVPVSYYFALNDKLPGQGVESHWGIFSADNSTNIIDDLARGGKGFASNIVFPVFNNYIGVNRSNHVVYNLNDPHGIIILACTGDQGEGDCYPLYGYNGSGKVKALTINRSSWSNDKKGYTNYTPGVNDQLMIDTSLNYYRSLYVIDGKSNEGLCWIDSAALTQLGKTINHVDIYWEANPARSCL